MRASVIAALLMALLPPASASADTTVRVGDELVVETAAGEVNDVRIEQAREAVVVRDLAARAVAGPGCVPVEGSDGHAVRCKTSRGEAPLGAEASLGAGDDRLEVTSVNGAPIHITGGGGTGDDVLRADAAGQGRITFDGGDGADTLAGSPYGDRLTGGAGDDRLLGGSGLDVLDGGVGADLMDGGSGADPLFAEDDVAVYADRADDLCVSLDGLANDGAVADLAATGDRRDDLRGIESVRGGQGDDLLVGDAGANGLDGGPGADALYGAKGDDRLTGGAGPDRLHGGDEADELIGGAGADDLLGGRGKDRASWADRGVAQPVVVDLDGVADDGGADDQGDGRRDLAAGVEVLVGGLGEDHLTGDDGPNELYGGDAPATPDAGYDDGLADELDGLGGADVLDGGPPTSHPWYQRPSGEDDFDGGSGDDLIRAQDGMRDQVACGPGADLAVKDADDVLTDCETEGQRGDGAGEYLGGEAAEAAPPVCDCGCPAATPPKEEPEGEGKTDEPVLTGGTGATGATSTSGEPSTAGGGPPPGPAGGPEASLPATVVASGAPRVRLRVPARLSLRRALGRGIRVRLSGARGLLATMQVDMTPALARRAGLPSTRLAATPRATRTGTLLARVGPRARRALRGVRRMTVLVTVRVTLPDGRVASGSRRVRLS